MAGADPRKLTGAAGIDLMRVETRDGRLLGHVFDVRCTWSPGAQASVIEEIIFGRVGLALRLGWQMRKPASVRWSQVEAVHDGVIVVTPDAAR